MAPAVGWESEDSASLILAEPMDAGSPGSSSHWLYPPDHFAGGSMDPSPMWSGGSMPPLDNASYGGPSDAGHAGLPTTSGGGYNHAGDSGGPGGPPGGPGGPSRGGPGGPRGRRRRR